MNLGKEIYKFLIKECGSIDNVKGASREYLNGLKSGNRGYNTKKLQEVFKANGIDKFTITLKGSKTETTIEL